MPFQTKTKAVITSLLGCVLFILGLLCRLHKKTFSFSRMEDRLHQAKMVCFQSESSQISYYSQGGENFQRSPEAALREGV